MVKTPSMKILFWFRKSEAKDQLLQEDPLGSIQCRISIENQTIEVGATKIVCKKSEWCPSGQRIAGKGQVIERANRTLNEITFRLNRLYDILLTKFDYVTPTIVKDHYNSRAKLTYSLKEINTKFEAIRTKMVEQAVITQSTLDINQNYARHILDYYDEISATKPYELPNTYLNDLYQFMIVTGRSGARFARKVCAYSKQVFKWAIREGMSPKIDALNEVVPGATDSEDYLDTTHLSIFQLDRLWKFDFKALVKSNQISKQTADVLSSERDAFVFNCFSGMHHCDYTKKEFRIEPYQDALFLKGTRTKTKKPFAVKLLEPAVHILKKYGGELRLLPVKSNKSRNITLKHIAVYVGIPQLLTTKVARKTFCDLAINELMMSTDDVAACLGLTSTKYLKNYGRIREKRLMKVMKSWHKLNKAS